MKRSREPEEYEDEEAPSPSPGPDGASPTPAPAPAPPASEFQRARKIASVDPDGDDGGGAEDDASARAPAGQNDATATATAVMRCSLPPHRDVLAFKTYADYEVHYSKAHTNRCVECRRNLPSEHLLGVHIEECHDVFAALRRERGEHTYSCFVEGCERKCRTPQKRRMHLIDKHCYPKNYFFAVTREGVDGRRSMLLEGGHRRRASSSAAKSAAPDAVGKAGDGVGSGAGAGAPRRREDDTPMEGVTTETKPGPDPEPQSKPPSAATTDEEQQRQLQGPEQQGDQKREPPGEAADVAMEDLSGAMSALRFVPPSIRFGQRRGGRAGFARQ